MNSNIHTSIDHLVIVSPTMAAGVTYVYETLGVMPLQGGIHIKMGTHNALLKLGPSTYLEVIAISPDLQKPDRHRWFSLDKLSPSDKPKLLTWVARTNDIRHATEISAISFGNIEAMSRGDLDWLITIPADGNVLYDGIAPSLIQWTSESHPSSELANMGCSLIRLEASHPEAETINHTLQSIGFHGNFSLDQSEKFSLVAYIQTPNGIRKFENRVTN